MNTTTIPPIPRDSWLPSSTIELYSNRDDEGALIQCIALRAAGALYHPWRGDVYTAELEHVLYSAHTHGYPLRLRELLGAPVYDLLHDIVGLMHHYDDNQHRMHGGFLPRYLDTADGEEVDA